MRCQNDWVRGITVFKAICKLILSHFQKNTYNFKQKQILDFWQNGSHFRNYSTIRFILLETFPDKLMKRFNKSKKGKKTFKPSQWKINIIIN